MSSLRDMGYDLPSAVADIVDNSIDAGARTMEITVCRKGEASFLRFVDDGTGMTERVLDEAMRYGSRRLYTSDELGKFGLGLKTASLSQCRRLSVATRTTLSGPIRIRRWDIDHVNANDAWELERLSVTESPVYLVEPLRRAVGTVVLWEKLDRILAYRRPAGEHAEKALEAMASSIADHLAMVFHRYLAGEASARRRLKIVFCGRRLAPWDPFARAERETQALPTQRLIIERDGSAHSVRVRPYILPSQVQFSSSEAHAAAGGPKRWNRQQGFYIYRGDRMIQSGGWNRLRTMDEHTKLARIAIDIPQGSESLFGINVPKMRVSLPDELRSQLSALSQGIVVCAQEAYRGRLRVVADSPEGRDLSTAGSGSSTMADVWPLIAAVIQQELQEHPALLEKLLTALANARPNTPLEEMYAS